MAATETIQLANDLRSCAELIDYVQRVGFLPLLDSGIAGYSADESVDAECRYVRLPDGGWDWPLWDWKGQVVTEGGCAYGKFFNKKAGFVSLDWWPDLCNVRRASVAQPDEVEETILAVLRERGSLVSRDLRAACGFDGKGMRGRFDAYITRLQMACRVVTEDFVYPTDGHGRRYGWGLALLAIPESLYGREACQPARSPEQSRQRITAHLRALLPQASPRQVARLVG